MGKTVEVHYVWNRENEEETDMRIRLEGKQALDHAEARTLS